MTSKRQAECEHSSWTIKPGGVVECRDCGEPIDESYLAGLGDDDPITVTMTVARPEEPHCLTYRIGELKLPELEVL